MTDIKDFTNKQAVAWVAQEAAKHDTAKSIKDRIASEEAQKIMFGKLNEQLPVSSMAHDKLVELLKVKLATLATAAA